MSRAILMARYLHKCSTNALEVVLMYLVAFCLSIEELRSLSAFMLGWSLNTISTSADWPKPDPEGPALSLASSPTEDPIAVGGFSFFFFRF